MLILHSAIFAQDKIEYYAPRTIALPGQSVRSCLPHIQDTIAWDTIYQVRAATGIPVSYFRKIQAPVCFDNKCRMLNIIVHWNVTGRYLGFELPTGEYLSKAEHEPFVFAEYERMHSILSDPFSPLGEIAYNELVPVKSPVSAEIDAVSSPTAKNLLEFVVGGAAFTTYKLWHIVHGTASEEVSRLTERELSPAYWLCIVKSPDDFDRLWALERRKLIQGSSEQIRDVLLKLIKDSDYNVAISAITAVSQKDLQTASFQVALLATLDEVDYALKKSIITKLGEASELERESIKALGERLSRLGGDLLAAVLRVLAEKQIHDDLINERVAELMKNPNTFISRQAYHFFLTLGIKDPQIVKEISDYEDKHSLK